VFLKSQKDIAKLKTLDESSILVLGCGYNYPDVILFSGVSKHVTGLDVMRAFYRDGAIETFKDLRNREGSTMKALLGTLLLRCRYHSYYDCLWRQSGCPTSHGDYSLFSYDGTRMPFEDRTFDIVISNAVLQEIGDLERVFQEVHRVTKDQGISYHVWHNYYSFSGSYMPEALCIKYPWGHLRGKYKPSTRLNKVTPIQLCHSFSGYFDLVALWPVDKNHRKKGIDADFEFEREELLSGSLRDELLRVFPEELLLSRSYLVIGKKRVKRKGRDDGTRTGIQKL
jgi:SAM-dependent methyltransferase